MRASDKEFSGIVASSISIADALRKMGLVPAGGNYRAIHANVKRLRLNTSHWLGKSHLRGMKRILPRVPLSEVLVENCEYNRACLKKRMLEEGLLESRCYECGQGVEWNGGDLVLVMDHINGVNNDNRIENLRLLCPNCNSQQKTFCGKKNEGKKSSDFSWKCERCGKTVSRGARHCSVCSGTIQRKVERPSLEELLEDRDRMTMVDMGKKYGVSDNAVRKWILKMEREESQP